MRLCEFNLFVLLSVLFFTSIQGAHFENFVNLTIKVEDVSFNFRIKDLKFNGEEVKLDDSDNFKPRKLVTHKLPPGRYTLSWTTERSATKWSAEPIVTHERILVLEGGDTNVRINIKGDTVNLY